MRISPIAVVPFLLSSVVFSCTSSDSANSPDADNLPEFGPVCCAVISYGQDCGYNIASSGAVPRARYESALVGGEELCDDIAQDIISGGASNCEDRSLPDHLSLCRDDSSLGKRRHLDSLSDPDWEIPQDYPQLSMPQEAAVMLYTFAGFVTEYRHTKLGVGIRPGISTPNFILSVQDQEEENFSDRQSLNLRIPRLESGSYRGTGREDEARLSISYAGSLYVTDSEAKGCEDSFTEVTVIGGNQFAVWGNVSAKVCDFDNRKADFEGKFSALRPGVRAAYGEL